MSLQERETKCVFGDKCRFIHDVSEYVSGKPPDLGDQCYLYNTFGKCHYGLTCRFAKAHISPDLKNVVNEDLYKPLEHKETVRNHLDKVLQKRLWKKQVAFTGAEAYLKTIVRGQKPEKKSTDPPDETTDAPRPQQTQQVTRAVMLNQILTDVRCVCVFEPQDDSSSTPVKTVGPITDADIIKLRPCERKQVCVTFSLILHLIEC